MMPPRGGRQTPGRCLWGYTDEFAVLFIQLMKLRADRRKKLGPITVEKADLMVEGIGM